MERIHKGKSIIDFPNKFTVIDIETTGLSPEYDFILEVSALKVENNQVTDSFTSLINQPVNLDKDYAEIVELTGITQSMLDTAPPEEDVLKRFYSFIGNDLLVGHNVNFDVNFLYDALDYYNIIFENNFIDTMKFSRRLLPELEHHRLIDIAQYYSIDTTGNHRALKDCEITLSCFSELINLALEKYGDLESFKSTWKHTNKHKLHAKDIQAETSDFDITHPLYKKTCVFTGTLQISRKDAMQTVVNLGGIVGDNVTKKTNYLILGNNDYCKTIKDGKSSKHKKADKLKAAGQDIEIIPEDVFFDMIEN